MRYPCPCPAWC